MCADLQSTGEKARYQYLYQLSDKEHDIMPLT